MDNCVVFEGTEEQNSSFNPWRKFIFIVLYQVPTTTPYKWFPSWEYWNARFDVYCVLMKY